MFIKIICNVPYFFLNIAPKYYPVSANNDQIYIEFDVRGCIFILLDLYRRSRSWSTSILKLFTSLCTSALDFVKSLRSLKKKILKIIEFYFLNCVVYKFNCSLHNLYEYIDEKGNLPTFYCHYVEHKKTRSVKKIKITIYRQRKVR